MGIYSILPSFGCLGVLLLIVATPLFSRADAPPSPASHRIRSIDGLRGFLALAVFFHHAAIYNLFLLDGHWDLTPSRFYNFLGPIGVSMFFMITGYLFWARVIREGAKPAWVSLYIGRIFRIGPLYLVAVAGMLLLVFYRYGTKTQCKRFAVDLSHFKMDILPRALQRGGREWLLSNGPAAGVGHVDSALGMAFLFQPALPFIRGAVPQTLPTECVAGPCGMFNRRCHTPGAKVGSKSDGAFSDWYDMCLAGRAQAHVGRAGFPIVWNRMCWLVGSFRLF
jgi:hypothetical protein